MKKAWLVCLLAGSAMCGVALATDGPDVIVGDLPNISRYNTATSEPLTALAVGTTSCNIGNARLNWFQDPDNRHPTIGQNLFRYSVVGGAGRFEQLGLSFVKHGFFALSQSLCLPCNDPTDGTALGVGCSDPYSSSLNGQQSGLGPRSQVNAATGFFPTDWNSAANLPSASWPASGSLNRRLQVQKSDLFPATNVGASYFVEGQYIAADDTASLNSWNNNSYRPVNVTHSVSSGTDNFTYALSSTTRRRMPAVEAWRQMDPTVTVVGSPFTTAGDMNSAPANATDGYTKIPGDGYVALAYKVTDLGGGQWQYEYALQNMTSDRSIGSFSVPMGDCAQATSIGFHDTFHHSGEAYSTSDWTDTKTATELTWATQSFATNANANAIRWGTLYNFRFISNHAPVDGNVTLGLFKPGATPSITIAAKVPDVCTGTVCVADMDDGTGTGTPDGGVTIDDLLYYIGIFGGGSIQADVDDGSGTGTPDGGVTIDDLLYFINRFNAGC
ncbi:MAG: hypothetical protein IPK69_01440 [Phycisphaerales bacterium]|nr:MAG: hypothetical protein IPK69_01440 [Phycisphaerales bacterium]